MVEQSAVNRWVVGSNPIRGDIWIFGEISGSSVAIFSSHEKLFVIVYSNTGKYGDAKTLEPSGR